LIEIFKNANQVNFHKNTDKVIKWINDNINQIYNLDIEYIKQYSLENYNNINKTLNEFEKNKDSAKLCNNLCKLIEKCGFCDVKHTFDFNFDTFYKDYLQYKDAKLNNNDDDDDDYDDIDYSYTYKIIYEDFFRIEDLKNAFNTGKSINDYTEFKQIIEKINEKPSNANKIHTSLVIFNQAIEKYSLKKYKLKNIKPLAGPNLIKYNTKLTNITNYSKSLPPKGDINDKNNSNKNIPLTVLDLICKHIKSS
jgi:hypothetical protein